MRWSWRNWELVSESWGWGDGDVVKCQVGRLQQRSRGSSQMLSKRYTDEENMMDTQMEYYSALKKNEIISFVWTMDGSRVKEDRLGAGDLAQ